MFNKEMILKLLNEDKSIVDMWRKSLKNADNDLAIIHAKNGLTTALVKMSARKEMLVACGIYVEYKNGIAVDVFASYEG